MILQELSTIVTGMTICDVDGKHIGTVDKFDLGEEINGAATDSEINIEAELKQIIGEHAVWEDLNADVYCVIHTHRFNL